MTFSEKTTQLKDKFRVLIVEDEVLVALEMQIILNAAGFDVVGVASNLANAIDIASRELPQLAIVDINLAGGDRGIDVVAKLKERGIPAIFSSGNCPQDGDDIVAIGCLHKPFDDNALIHAVHMAQAIIDNSDMPAIVASFDVYQSARKFRRV